MVWRHPCGGHAPPRMFFFFSNTMGCLPSLLLSAVVTLVLLVLTGVVDV